MEKCCFCGSVLVGTHEITKSNRVMVGKSEGTNDMMAAYFAKRFVLVRTGVLLSTD